MKRDYTFDIARALSMFYIICIWHLANYTNTFSMIPYGGDFITNAALGLFMFISAYLLEKKYSFNNNNDLKLFFKKRVLRIMPLFGLSLLLFLLFKTITFKQAILSLFGLSTFILPQPPTLWFVSMIIIFYILFPILSMRKKNINIICFVSIYVILYVIHLCSELVDTRFFYYFPCFMLGILLSKYNKEDFINLKSVIISIIIILLTIKLYLASENISENILGYMLISIISISGTIIILFISKILAKNNIIVKLMSPIAYGSMVSYMFHRQILATIEKFIYWPEDGLSRLLFLVFICVPLILIFGYYIQYAYDKLLTKLKF